MTIDYQDVRRSAHLARLRCSDAELDALVPQLVRVLEYMEELRAVPTDEVEPLTHPNLLTNQWREDIPTPSLPREDAMANAPRRHGDYFVVPRILE